MCGRYPKFWPTVLDSPRKFLSLVPLVNSDMLTFFQHSVPRFGMAAPPQTSTLSLMQIRQARARFGTARLA
jgi:hypothetical protein